MSLEEASPAARRRWNCRTRRSPRTRPPAAAPQSAPSGEAGFAPHNGDSSREFLTRQKLMDRTNLPVARQRWGCRTRRSPRTCPPAAAHQNAQAAPAAGTLPSWHSRPLRQSSAPLRLHHAPLRRHRLQPTSMRIANSDAAVMRSAMTVTVHIQSYVQASLHACSPPPGHVVHRQSAVKHAV